MKNIAVIFGGKSSEHDISIITACTLMQNLNKHKFKIVPIYIQKNGELLYSQNFEDINVFRTGKICGKSCTFICGKKELFVKTLFGLKPMCKIDFCFVACHGVNGEDGSVSGLLNLCGLPYSCADILPSSVAINKVATKYVCKANKIPVVNFVKITKNNFVKNETKKLLEIITKIGFPCIVKPVNLGSSIGISVCKNKEELLCAANLAFNLDTEILVEKALENFNEYNIAVLKFDGKINLSKIEQPLFKNEILSFEDKYLSQQKVKGMEGLSRIFPANLPEKIEKNIKNYAKKIYEILNFSGVVRIDFLCVNDKVYLNEINSIPGSFANYLWGFSYPHLLEKIMQNAIEEFQQKQALTYTFSSSVLQESFGKEMLKK